MVIWSAAAQADLAWIFDFNIAGTESRAFLVDQRIAEQAEMIGLRPLIGRKTRLAGVREWTIVDVQYVLRYRVSDPVEILRAFSTRENRGAP